jgi:hypothetical protein
LMMYINNEIGGMSWPWTLDRSRRLFRCSLGEFLMEVQTVEMSGLLWWVRTGSGAKRRTQ